MCEEAYGKKNDDFSNGCELPPSARAADMDPYYFGNVIQSIPSVAAAGELLSRDLRRCADLLHRNVVAHDDATVRRGVADWEREPRLFPLGNFDGASMTMGNSPRFPMYENDFGWGRPVAVRRTNSMVRYRLFQEEKAREVWILRWFWHRKQWRGLRGMQSSCNKYQPPLCDRNYFLKMMDVCLYHSDTNDSV